MIPNTSMKIQNVRTHSARPSVGTDSVPLSGTNPSFTRPASQPKRKAPPSAQSDTIRVDFTDPDGTVFDSAEWPVEIWEAAQQRARALGLTIDQYINSLLRQEVDRSSIAVTPKNLSRVQAVAAMLEISPEKYLDWVLNNFLDDVYDAGRIFEIEVDGMLVFDSKAEARRICRKVIEFDAAHGGFKRDRFKLSRDSDGKWQANGLWREIA